MLADVKSLFGVFFYFRRRSIVWKLKNRKFFRELLFYGALLSNIGELNHFIKRTVGAYLEGGECVLQRCVGAATYRRRSLAASPAMSGDLT